MIGYVEDYILFLKKERHRTENTIESYKRDLTQFIKYLQAQGIDSVTDITRSNVLSFLVELRNAGKAASTLSRTLCSIRSFLLYLLQTGVAHYDPTLNLETPPIEKKPPKILTVQELDHLMNQPDLTQTRGLRDRAMLELLYATGIRVSELICLNLEHIYMRQRIMSCPDAKRRRMIPIGHSAYEALNDYINTARPKLVTDESQRALFVNYSGNRITRQGFWKIMKQYGRQAGIETEITPHTLRHSFAAHLLENGADMKSIQTLMGYADISSTQVYAQFMTSNLQQVYAKSHPRA